MTDGGHMTTTELATYTIGDQVEDFVLPDLPGRELRLSETTGEWTVLYFTTTWCPYVLDRERVIRYAEYLNMERFDSHVASLVEALERLTGGPNA